MVKTIIHSLCEATQSCHIGNSPSKNEPICSSTGNAKSVVAIKCIYSAFPWVNVEECFILENMYLPCRSLCKLNTYWYIPVSHLCFTYFVQRVSGVTGLIPNLGPIKFSSQFLKRVSRLWLCIHALCGTKNHDSVGYFSMKMHHLMLFFILYKYSVIFPRLNSIPVDDDVFPI